MSGHVSIQLRKRRHYRLLFNGHADGKIRKKSFGRPRQTADCLFKHFFNSEPASFPRNKNRKMSVLQKHIYL